jgi:hypothetical protein
MNHVPSKYEKPGGMLQNYTELNHNRDTLRDTLNPCQLALEIPDAGEGEPRVAFRGLADNPAGDYHPMAREDEVNELERLLGVEREERTEADTALGKRIDVETAERKQADDDIWAKIGTFDDKYVNANGDTMTGYLTLFDNPTGGLHAATKQYVDGKDTATNLRIDGKEDKANKGVSNGYASLDSNTKIPLSQLPDAILGQMVHAGEFVPSTAVATLTTNGKTLLNTTSNTITLVAGASGIGGYLQNQGNYYLASSPGTFAGITFAVGDWLVGNAAGWAKIDNTDAVTGVKGNAETNYRIGNINITPANIGLGDVENTKLSTWAGSENITQIGTLVSGNVPWARITGAPSFAAVGHTHAAGDITSGALPISRGGTGKTTKETASAALFQTSISAPNFGYLYGESTADDTGGLISYDSFLDKLRGSLNDYYVRKAGDTMTGRLDLKSGLCFFENNNHYVTMELDGTKNKLLITGQRTLGGGGLMSPHVYLKGKLEVYSEDAYIHVGGTGALYSSFKVLGGILFKGNGDGYNDPHMVLSAEYNSSTQGYRLRMLFPNGSSTTIASYTP